MGKEPLPARAVSPGRIIKRELEARDWTQRDLASIMGRPYQAINEIVRGNKQITPDTARELAQAFGTSSDFWMNLESNYRLHLAKKDDKEQLISRKSKLYSIAPLRELIKRGWIEGSDNLDELENQVCDFLNVNTPEETPEFVASFRHSYERGPEGNSVIAWGRRVAQLAKQQDIGNFNPDRLIEVMLELLDNAADPQNVALVPNMLLNCGVHFMIVPHLPKTYLDGAAFVNNGNPIVALTLRYDRID